jgi:hypothetical protein
MTSRRVGIAEDAPLSSNEPADVEVNGRPTSVPNDEH